MLSQRLVLALPCPTIQLLLIVPKEEKYVLSVCKYKEEKQGKTAYEIDEIPLEM